MGWEFPLHTLLWGLFDSDHERGSASQACEGAEPLEPLHTRVPCPRPTVVQADPDPEHGSACREEMPPAPGSHGYHRARDRAGELP